MMLPPTMVQRIAEMTRWNPIKGLKPMKTPIASPIATECGVALMRRTRCHTYRPARFNPDRGQMRLRMRAENAGRFRGLNIDYASPWQNPMYLGLRLARDNIK